MERREALRWMAGGAAANLSALLAAVPARAAAPAPASLPPAKITKVKAILTAPPGLPRTVVVKIETDQAGLYGWGCATFTQRAKAVVTAVNEFLDPFLRGKDPDAIGDIWQTMYVSSYWRNGPVLYNAMSGVDQALWDIKGRRANMPVYQLLGGKVRQAADVYRHASGSSPEEVEEQVRGYMEQGARHVRIQMAIAGQANYGARVEGASGNGFLGAPSGGNHNERMYEPTPYLLSVPKLFAHMRKNIGEEIELLHDVHERISNDQAMWLCKRLEEYRPFFLEDPVSPEQIGYFKLIRQQCTTSIAMGELFNSPHEYVGLISERLIDFIRIHVSQIGGVTPAKKVAHLAEFFGVRTAWHGPGDTSPVGHLANIALDVSSYAFGIQEASQWPDSVHEVFQGCPKLENGFFYPNEAPGWGMEVDETLAAKYDVDSRYGEPFDYSWGTTRRRDGSIIRP
ncbi:MAG: starvation-sensing protein RspA [Acidobacteria bacterium]|nr:starvation-sensing protein RspA [Acidobacteriota bacterium]